MGLFDLASNLGDSFCSLSLASSLSAGATGVVTVTETNGYSMANMAAKGFLVIDPGTSSKEKIYYSARDTTAKTITIATRGVGETNDVAHNAGATIINPPLFEYLEQILSGPSTFTTPIISGYTTNNSRVLTNLTSNQTGIVSGVSTKITFDNEISDVGGNFNTSTNTYTAPSTTQYWIDIQVGYSNVTMVANKRYGYIVAKNGSTFFEYTQHSAVTESLAVGRPRIVSLTAGDTLTVNAYHLAGTNQTIFGGNDWTWFNIIPL